MCGLGAFIEDEQGAVTIEFVTIFQAFVFVLAMFTDASILYLTHTELFEISRDTARQLSVGSLHIVDVEDYVRARAMLGQRTYTAASFSGSVVIVELGVNVADASIFGFFEPVLGRTMSVRVEMLREPSPPPCRTC